MAVVSWYEIVDEDGSSMDDRVIIQLLYLVLMMDMVMLTVMSVRIPFLTFSFQRPSFVGSCWWTTAYKIDNASSFEPNGYPVGPIANALTMHVTYSAACRGFWYTD